MVVLTSKDGVHRCDARCYNATWFTCECICRGKNHGVGLDQALKLSERDLSIYGDTVSEQAEGLRFELEHEKESEEPEDRSLKTWSNFVLKHDEE